MTQEEKQLLLKDLCARLPYGVKCRFETTVDTYKTIELSRQGTNGLLVDFDELYCYWFNEGFMLPYLRSMSSMTEEERENYRKAFDEDFAILADSIEAPIAYKYHDGMTVRDKPLFNELDWLNAHHFDYRGLIEKGLALEAPKGMYKIE